MDYIFVFLLWLFGTLFHVMLKIKGLRTKFPELGFKVIWNTFFQQEWDSLMVSVLIISVYELAMYIISYNQIGLPGWFDNYGMYGLAIVLGYGGQALAYKWLNTAQQALEKKADDIKDKL